MYSWCPQRPEEGVESSGTRVVDVSHHVGAGNGTLASARATSICHVSGPLVTDTLNGHEGASPCSFNDSHSEANFSYNY